MADGKSNKRKVLFINPRFQLSFIAYMVCASMVTTIIYYVGVYYFFWKFRAIGQAAGLSEDHIFFRFIAEQQTMFNWGFLIVSALAVIVLVAAGAYMSQRVAGPLHRLNGHMRRVAAGETTAPVAFREKDYFPELAASYNAQLEKLRIVDKKST